MLQELQGPGISARGASFAGVEHVRAARPRPGLRVERHLLRPGHHRHVRRRAVHRTAAPRGSRTTSTTAPALPMEKLEQHQRLEADGRRRHRRPARTAMQVYRTKYGLVTYRATVGGKTVAFTTLRSTYRHEADSIIGFQMFNDPAYDGHAATFQQRRAATSATPSTGSTSTPPTPRTSTAAPTRCAPPASTRTCPVWAEPAYEWQGWNPTPTPPTYTPAAAHPQSVNQDYYISWNNKQAKDYTAAAASATAPCTAATCSTTGSRRWSPAGGRSTRASLTKAMAEAARHRPARPRRCCPSCCRCIDSHAGHRPRAGRGRQQAAGLADGRRASARRPSPGSQDLRQRRRDPDPGRLVAAAGRGRVRAGPRRRPVHRAVTANLADRRVPVRPRTAPTGAHAGSSSFQYGWWGYVDKDIRDGARRAGAGRAGRRRTAAAAASAPAATSCCTP